MTRPNPLPPLVQTRIATRLGDVRLAASPRGLAGLWFDGQRHQPTDALDGPRAWPEDAAHPVLRAAAAQLLDYLEGRRKGFDLPLDLVGGTPFQQSVWQALAAIPHGAVTSYAALARGLGRPLAVRAVGAAVGRNPVSVIVPCHRVLGSGGALTGYAGGLPRKTALLRLEGALPEGLHSLPLWPDADAEPPARTVVPAGVAA
ncbi:methylated-DNA--[protein]-cysteine S-methyltransferase [Acidovorax sp. GBBC 3334]|uniref:methylated-DNA--[protein]-cysteine S-methyltransferase n=1 Tax=Acidovorax sp. GBBC 3334 TaxID=2940496 RepID=UPI002303F5DA|nr:methylated-DNA--[protein]-cysteine S-methyltransferase [Acidovorax sp. GBBC 3334]MDA8456909.1 methylated-DNA--[protein]-cysteine S-methyltransferase [Acidovorax sp. GBBC 3334]